MSKQSDLVSVSQGASGDPLYIDTTNDRVGVGTSSPEGQLHLYTDSVGAPSSDADDFIIEKTGDTGLSILSTTTGRIYFGDAASNDQGSIRYIHSDNSMRFETDSSERMRIDSSGHLLVGTTDNAVWNDTSGTGGINARSDGILAAARNGGEPLLLNRLGTDGELIKFKKNGSDVGNIGTAASYVYVANGSRGLHFGYSGSDSQIVPCNGTGSNLDNVIDLGSSSVRFDDIYATNGTIQTSDRNEKQDIEALSDAEQRVAVAAKGLLRKYRWKDAVAEKGDEARIHFGIIAQDLQAAFEAEGLDAGRYGMFISSTWWEAEVEQTREVEQEDGTTVTETYAATETYNEPTEGATERTRLGVRYPELLAFIIAAL